MASEPLFEEQSDAVKVVRLPYPTNGSGKNLAKNTGIKYTFCDYPMPDSLLRVILYSFLPSSFRICPPLKNDGTSELRFREAVNDFSPKKKSTGNVSCPRLSGSKRTTFRGAERRCKSE